MRHPLRWQRLVLTSYGVNMMRAAFGLLLVVSGCWEDPKPPDCRDLGCSLALCNPKGECKCGGKECRFYTDAGIGSGSSAVLLDELGSGCTEPRREAELESSEPLLR